MRQGDQQWSDRVMEKWSNEIFNTPTLQHSNTSTVGARRIPRRAKATRAFALYEVLIGEAVFALGVIALGRAVENCINASTISAEDNVWRQILSDKLAEFRAPSLGP